VTHFLNKKQVKLNNARRYNRNIDSSESVRKNDSMPTKTQAVGQKTQPRKR
jgi:hypothetical protein